MLDLTTWQLPPAGPRRWAGGAGGGPRGGAGAGRVGIRETRYTRCNGQACTGTYVCKYVYVRRCGGIAGNLGFVVLFARYLPNQPRRPAKRKERNDWAPEQRGTGSTVRAGAAIGGAADPSPLFDMQYDRWFKAGWQWKSMPLDPPSTINCQLHRTLLRCLFGYLLSWLAGSRPVAIGRRAVTAFTLCLLSPSATSCSNLAFYPSRQAEKRLMNLTGRLFLDD